MAEQELDIDVRYLYGRYYVRHKDLTGPGAFGKTKEAAIRELRVLRKEYLKWKAAVARLGKIPGVGPSAAFALAHLGFDDVHDLIDQDPDEMYDALYTLWDGRPGVRYRDVFASAIAYARGEGYRPWWEFARERKAAIEAAVGQPNIKPDRHGDHQQDGQD
jgi:hypothetical protein